MTAWAAGKFAGDDVGMFVKKSGIEEKVKNKEVIIPGTPPPSPATWKRNCPVGRLRWDPGSRAPSGAPQVPLTADKTGVPGGCLLLGAPLRR